MAPIKNLNFILSRVSSVSLMGETSPRSVPCAIGNTEIENGHLFQRNFPTQM